MPTDAKHARDLDPSLRRTRLAVLLVVWLGGLAAGFFGILATAARYGCGNSATGLGCSTSGTVLGVALIVAVIVIVTALTVYSHERRQRPVLGAGAVAILGLVLCYLGAQGLLSTV